MTRRTRKQLLVAVLLLTLSCSKQLEDPKVALQRATQTLREGRASEAVAFARAGAERYASLDDPTWRWRFRLLEAEGHLFLRQPKEAAAVLDERIPSEQRLEQLQPRHAYLNAYVQILSGNAVAGLTELPDIAARAKAAGVLEVSLDAIALQAQLLLRQGKFDVADRMLLDALAPTTDDVAYHRGALLLNLGMSRLVRNRFDEALSYFERVLVDRSIESTLVYRAALSNAGICYSRLGDIDGAIALQRRAIDGHERAGVDLYLQQSLGELGTTFMLGGRTSDSLGPLQRALNIALTRQHRADAVEWANNLATAYGDLADWERAEQANNVAMGLMSDARASSLTYYIYNRARIAAGRGQSDAAISGFEEALSNAGNDPFAAWMAHAGLAQVYRSTNRMQDATRHFEEALGLIERTRVDLLKREHRLTFLSRLIRFHQNYVDALVATGDVERALEVAEASRARVLAERHGVVRAARIPATQFVQMAARTNTVLLSYWLAPTRSFVWVITRAGIRCVTLPSRHEIEPLVRGYRDFVTVSLADPLAAASSPGTRLTETLLAPVLDAIPSGASVVIVPDDALHSLSFDMLPLPSPQPHYWIEDVTITLAPSLALATESQTRRAHAEPSLLLIGDPTHVDTALPPLTFAGTELSGIERAFGGQTQILRGADATPGAVTSAHPERFSLIHFAAHATASAESPLESAILLSPEPHDPGTAKAVPYVRDESAPQASKPPNPQASPQAPGPRPQAPSLSSYKLYARDVTALPLAADVVTLSACRSAGGRAYGGEGLVGFAWAFLRAGARQVVAGLWDVDDQATALLMERFYGRLGAGAAPATALRDAKLSLLKSGGNFRKPYYWAAFAVFSSSLDPL